MSFLYLTGARFNTFGRGSVSISPSAASVSDAANLYDSDPGCPLLFGSAAAGYAKVDCNALTNPGFETSTLSGWTDDDTGAGASTETTTAGEFRSGTKAMKLVPGVGTASRSQTITVRPGEYRKASFYAKLGAQSSFTLSLYNTKTQKYYNGSSWTSSSADAITQTNLVPSGSFDLYTVTYQVETFDQVGDDSGTIRWRVSCSNGLVYVDDCLDICGVSFASVHGHNLIVDPTVESSDDDSSWTTRATMTRKRPAFWTSFSIVYARYWKIAFSAASSAPYIGDAVLGQYETSATPILRGPATNYDMPGARDFNGIGRSSAYSYTTDPREGVHLEFSADTEAAAREAIYGIFVRSKQGQLPVVVVPLSTETSVYFGRVSNPFTQERPHLGIYGYGFDVIGDSLPTVGA